MKTIEITTYRSQGRSQKITAKLLRVSKDQATLETGVALDVGSIITLSDESFDRTSFTVRTCALKDDGLFEVGVGRSAEQPEPDSGAEFVDYYEVLQVNPAATEDTIGRVFRMLAQRYHPDNSSTGDAELFRLVATAHKALSDPETRAAFDLKRDAALSMRWKLFESAEQSTGIEAERIKRNGILGLLYNRRLAEPRKPGMTIRTLEQMLNCPAEHLENPIWYLARKKWVSQGDGAALEITVDGMDAYESSEDEKVREALMIEESKDLDGPKIVHYAPAGKAVG